MIHFIENIWTSRYLNRIDLRMILVLLALMGVSLLIMSSYTIEHTLFMDTTSIVTPMVKKQLQAYFLGALAYFFLAGFDYNKLREGCWILYLLMLISLIGLFFTDSIVRVHRWYRIPLIGFNFQPSEYAKLSIVITLSWYLEKIKTKAHLWSSAFFCGVIVGIPFLLILKQPDLGSALILYPITLVMFYFGNINPIITRTMSIFGLIILSLTLAIFIGLLPYESLQPYAKYILKEYQFDRFNPDNHHQKASMTAIAIGGIAGKGWRKNTYTSEGWLPAPHTDSVFPAFSEEFGLIGQILVIALFYALIYFGFQVTAIAKDHFGRLLSAGITVYLAMHVIVNIGMMCGLLPITGVPLIMITSGGSSILATMSALGILQSIYSRRFMF